VPRRALATLARAHAVAAVIEHAVRQQSFRAVAGPDHQDPFSLMEPIGLEPDPKAVRTLRVAYSPNAGLCQGRRAGLNASSRPRENLRHATLAAEHAQFNATSFEGWVVGEAVADGGLEHKNLLPDSRCSTSRSADSLIGIS
jgi:hypothetical protein